MKRSRWQIVVGLGLGLVLCGVILVTGPQPLEASVPEGKPRITVGELKRASMPRAISAYGTLSPRQVLELTTQVPGEITWVHQNLVPGGTLAAEDALFRIDERDYKIAVASAEARYAQALATIDIEQGRSEIAQLEWSAWQATQGGLEEPSPLALRAPQKAEAEAQRKAILAEIEQSKLALERTAVSAPWAASVVQANAVQGQFLSVGEVIATLLPIDHAIVELQVPIQTLRLLEAGIETITLRPVDDRGDDSSAPEVIGIFDSVVKTLTDDTRLATVRVRVERPLDHSGWVFGMHLQAKIVARDEVAVALIPPDLIVSGNLLWIYREGRAQQHQVFPLEQSGTLVSVEDNFRSGDAIILERPIGLFDGAAVDAAY